MDKMSGNIYFDEGKVKGEDRCRVFGHKGLVAWFTGLSGSGKSTISVQLEKRLNEWGKAVYRLDGDNIRSGINSDLDFSEKDRNENIRRISEIAALFKDAGLITLVSAISPFRKMRDFAKEKSGNDHFVEIYVKADVETCALRDPKGLYKKALDGQIKDFTGISSPYEEPVDPDVILDTRKLTLKECVDKVFGVIIDKTALI